jgi:thiol-disulfide isomerase/thioredoxin
VVGILVALVSYRLANDTADSTVSTKTATDGEPAQSAEPSAAPSPSALSAGRYQTYEPGLVDDEGYATTILFFYAGWCPECRGYDQAITAGSIPSGVQILQVTYDDAQDLRKKYGVTIQSTFVRVDASGDKQVLWNGYGRDKSLNAILENTQ